MYSYDRTAAQMSFFGEWQDIVEKHRREQSQEFEKLLQEAAKYLRSVGLVLNVKESWLGVRHNSSDGPRMEGTLVVSEAPENTVKVDKPAMIGKWIEEALNTNGYARRTSDGPAKRQVDDLPVGNWIVDISDY